MARLARDPGVEALIDAYRADLLAAGHFAENEVTSPARAFLLRIGGPSGWSRLSVADQRRICEPRESALVMWMIAAGHLRATPEFLAGGHQRLGKVAAWVHSDFHRRFMQIADGIGFSAKAAELQWWAVAKIAAVAGVPPHKLNRTRFDAARAELLAAALREDRRSAHRSLSTRLYGAEATLYHAGVIDQTPRKRAANQATLRQQEWASVPARLAETLQGYAEQMRVTLRPNSMPHIERTLREFALWLRDQAPEVTAVRDLRRAHIERYKRHVAQKPNLRGGRLSKRTLAGELSTLRICLERLGEWDGEDAPARTLMFPGDVPKLDDPLPRFIDDGAARKLIQAARASDDRFARLTVEFLARTGLRRGEFLDLKIDSVVQIGAAYWLHVPLGKLRTDRYIPLHPQLKELLDEWVAARPANLREPWLFMDHGRRLGPESVRQALLKVAEQAGLGPVTPHQLRHTLATQAINRGMSLEAIAALLGHKSMRMTMVYAKIANRTVADEYFKVSEQVEALYDAPKQLPPDAEGTEMRKLRAEIHRRMLGNGYCARPVGLDCHFESICESCTYFQTTHEFRPTLQRQRDDAADKGQVGRLKVFDGLLERLDDQAQAS
ncbi:MAG: site-specific integrase [Solirubrobacteraceae bacterium]